MYGDAEDEEHIKLARVLMTILLFDADDAAAVEHKIAYYESSSWHRTGNLLTADGADAGTATFANSLWGTVASIFGGAAATDASEVRSPIRV